MSSFKFDPSDIEYSEKVSNKRIEGAIALIGEKTVKRIIGLALFFLGGNRKKISEMLNLPIGTFFTFLTRFHNNGMDAFCRKPRGDKAVEINEKKEDQNNVADFLEKTLNLKQNRPLQHKVLILTLLNWELISSKKAAEHLGISEGHTRLLAKQLEANDVDILMDKREGQQQDYHFSTEVKAELIQQFSFNVVTGKNASSQQLCQQVNEACGTNISDRSIRIYMNKLGLAKIKNSLFDMVEEFKKKFPT